MAFFLEGLGCPFPKPLNQLKEDLDVHQIYDALLRKKMIHLKQFGQQNPLCSLPFDRYEALPPTEQHASEKGTEAEELWSKLSFDVCNVCQGCHLTITRKTLLAFGHIDEIQRKTMYGSCANNPKNNTAQNRVIPYWIDRHGSRHTTVPQELSDLTFAEKQLIAVASRHVSLIHLKNDTLGSRGALCGS
jgi:hypothetical protein